MVQQPADPEDRDTAEERILSSVSPQERARALCDPVEYNYLDQPLRAFSKVRILDIIRWEVERTLRASISNAVRVHLVVTYNVEEDKYSISVQLTQRPWWPHPSDYSLKDFVVDVSMDDTLRDTTNQIVLRIKFLVL